jgi:uncharacterized protein YkwD
MLDLEPGFPERGLPWRGAPGVASRRFEFDLDALDSRSATHIRRKSRPFFLQTFEMAADRVGCHPLRLHECAAKRADLRDRGYDHVIAAFDNGLENHGVRMDTGLVLRRHGYPLVGETTLLQKAGQRRSRLTVALLILVVASARAEDFEAVRAEFLAGINSRRVEQGVAPLRLSRPLVAVAQQLAEDAVRRLDPTTVDQEEIVRRAEKAGYSAKGIAEVFTLADGNVDEVIRFLSESGDSSWQTLLSKTLLDVGVGVAILDDAPLYVFVLGVSWEDYTAGRAEEYRDLPAMRREMLQRVNAERRRRDLPALRPTPVLDRIAQAYAEDMLSVLSTATRVPKARRSASGRPRPAIASRPSGKTSRAGSPRSRWSWTAGWRATNTAPTCFRKSLPRPGSDSRSERTAPAIK